MADTPTTDADQPEMGKKAENGSRLDDPPSEPPRANGGEKNSDPSDATHFIIKLCKDYKISINKPLILLKVALFTYYGAGSFMPSFMTVLYKQRGVSLAQLSTFTILAPIFQFIGSALSGIVADKIGRSKPVLVTNLLLVTLTVLCILLTPKIDSSNCTEQKLDLFCNDQQTRAHTEYSFLEGRIDINTYQAKCSKNGSVTCNDQTSACIIFVGKDFSNISLVYIDKFNNNRIKSKIIYNVTALEFQKINSSWCKNGSVTCNDQTSACIIFVGKDFRNISLTVYIDKFNNNRTKSKIIYNVTEFQKINKSWCNSGHTNNCSISCEINSEIRHCTKESSNYLLLVYGCLFIIFLTTYSNVYRCMDVTTMFLSKEHHSDFGHERFFAISGNLLISPLAGFIAEITSPMVGEKNYAGALYLFIVMACFLFPVIYKLPVRVVSPGEKMLEKSLILLKNLDVVVFFIVILILGTSWNFTKYFLFWYLEEMHAPSFLIGLITSVSALYGLPFLLTSKWWVKKIGPRGIIILAFVAYGINSIGYSFLRNPWFSLVLEATGILNYYLLWVAVVEHSHNIAPEGLTSTIITISGAIHYSVGKSTSGLTGGLIMNTFGGQVAFRFISLLCLTSVFLYGSFLYFRHRYTSMKHKIDPSEHNMKAFHIDNAEIR